MRDCAKCAALGLAMAMLGAGAALGAAAEGVQMTIEDDDNALVYSPAVDVELALKATNLPRTDLRLVATVGAFEGLPLTDAEVEQARAAGETVVEYGVQKYFRINMLADQTVKSVETVLKAGSEGQVRLNLGKLPPGFYMLDISLLDGGARQRSLKNPLAVLEDLPSRSPDAPVYRVGVYTRYMQYKKSADPIFWKTYLHAIAHDFKKHNINTMIAAGGFDPGELDILQSYGIAGISRGGGQIEHPAVIATFVGDEPKPGEEVEKLKKMYADLAKTTDKIITTCMVGEGMGLGVPGDPVNLWKELQPKVRVFRWYGVKKSFYDALYPVYYKGTLPLTSVLHIAETSSETPWWIILPAFGKDDHEAYFQNPSPAQLTAMMHLSCAYGCDGILFFQYQVEGMADFVTLKPRDGKLAAAGKVAGYFNAHAGLVNNLTRAGLDVRCPSPVVEALPVKGAEDQPLYVYAVNKDAKNAVSTRLMLWAEQWSLSRVEDVYTGRKLEVQPVDQEGYLSVPLTLEPGEGMLLRTDVVNKKPS